MAALDGTTLTQVAVTLAGAWYPEPQRWRWEGMITADEPLVGIVLCEQPGTVQWARSDHRASAAGLPVVLSFASRGSQVRIHAGVGHPSRRGFVQSRTLAVNPDPPLIANRMVASTATDVRLASVLGDPVLSVSVLCIVRRDVRSRRLGLWGVRPSLLGDLNDPWRTVLCYGRAGELRL